MASLAGASLMSACGGGANDAPLDAAATAAANEQGQRSILATTRVTTTTAPIVGHKLNACIEAVASSWDIKLAACNGSDLQKFVFTPVASGSDVYTLKNQQTALCIKATGTSAGAFVELDSCNGKTAQQFQLELLEDNSAIEFRRQYLPARTEIGYEFYRVAFAVRK